MGAGGDGRPLANGNGMRRATSIDKLKQLGLGISDDLTVLKSIWFNKPSGKDHAQRLENFYSPQAHACKAVMGLYSE